MIILIITAKRLLTLLFQTQISLPIHFLLSILDLTFLQVFTFFQTLSLHLLSL